MNKIYSNKIFNWILLIVSLLILIDNFSRINRSIEFNSAIVLKIALVIFPILSALSFFIKKLNKEFYSRAFILLNLIFPPIYLYYQYLIHLLIYSINRTDLISTPIIHFYFFIFLVLFYLSLRLSKQTNKQRQKEYGMMLMIYGIFLLIINITTNFDSHSVYISEITSLIKILISIAIIFLGNKLRFHKIKFKKTIILSTFIAIINSFL